MQNQFEKFGFIKQNNDFKDLDTYILEDVALILLNKYKNDPKASRAALNHLEEDILGEFKIAMYQLALQPIKSILVSSAHKVVFSRGAKIEKMIGVNFEKAYDFIRMGQKFLLALHQNPKPIIAAWNGLVLGGALEVSMACDYRISSDRSNIVIGLPEAALGLVPAMGGTQNMRRLIGEEKARHYMSHALADITPAQALLDGLVDKVFPYQQFVAQAFQFAKQDNLKKALPESHFQEMGGDSKKIRNKFQAYMKNLPPNSKCCGQAAPLASKAIHYILDNTKNDNYHEGLLHELEAISYLVETKDAQEGLKALAENRKANFSGS